MTLGHSTSAYGVIARMAIHDPNGVIPIRVWDTERDEEIEPVRMVLGVLHSEETKCCVSPKVNWAKEGF